MHIKSEKEWERDSDERDVGILHYSWLHIHYYLKSSFATKKDKKNLWF